jgi:hypothetical protein
MTRDEHTRLVDFCAVQHTYFDVDAWMIATNVDSHWRRHIALAARFLSLTHWYGDVASDAILTKIAFSLEPELMVLENFTKLCKDEDFDCGHFSAALKVQISKRRLVVT